MSRRAATGWVAASISPALRSHQPQHRVPAVLADHVLRVAHPRDRLVLAAVGALGDQLVAPKTVHAAIAARELRRPKPGLAAARAGGPPQGTAAAPIRPGGP